MSKNIFFLNIKNISKKFKIMSPNILLNLNVSWDVSRVVHFIDLFVKSLDNYLLF